MRALIVLLLSVSFGCVGYAVEDGPRRPGQTRVGPVPGTVDAGTPDVIPAPNTIPTATLFECTGAPQPSPARIRRIDNVEWTRNIGSRINTSTVLNPLVAHPAHRYTTWADDETLDAVTLDRFFDFVGASAGDWRTTEGKPSEVYCIYNDAAPDEACVRRFVDYFLPGRVLYRPATDAERDRLVQFALAKLEESVQTGRDRESVMRQITSAAWLTTGALFRPELGRGASTGDGVTALDANELAMAISFALSDFAPGGPEVTASGAIRGDMLGSVRAAAEDGTIFDPDVIRGLIAEHIGGVDPTRADLAMAYDARERDVTRRGQWWVNGKIRRFFREWLDFDGVNTAFKDTPAATSGYEELDYVSAGYAQLLSGYYGYEATIDEQLDDMIARIIVEDTDVLRTLLTTNRFFLPSNLSDTFGSTDNFHYIYGYTADIADSPEARWIELPSDQRAGVLTHPAWLAAHGDNFENGPSAVVRGKWIRENLLCGVVPDVPITVNASFPPSTDQLSARERLTMATSDQYCQDCHSLMNPLGLPFELYNHAGYWRMTDHGQTPSGTSLLIATGDAALDTEVEDAVDMVHRLADSQLVERCFIRQVFRFFAGRPETQADACTLTAMEDAYQESGGSFSALLGALMTSPAFLERTVVAEETQP